MQKMCHFHPPSWYFFRPRDFSKSKSEGALKTWPYFYSSPCMWRLASGLHLGEFSVRGIYVETYVYDDVCVHVLMTSYFRTSDHRVR